MFSKVLVANRGEIAIRAFRAAYELGARTVAVFPLRGPLVRAPAQGRRGLRDRRARPPGAGLPRPRRRSSTVAVRAGADAVYPGYGFLSENPALAEACANAGITFVGPPADVLTLTGNKARAIAAAKAAGVPTLASVEPSHRRRRAGRGRRGACRYPLFVKAVAGGGGRGMRRVDEPEDLREAVETCMREAEGAFGDPTVFIEQAVVDPRHIEVQILADGEGNVIHLFERDCSVQRRHQKVVEIAPAPNLDPELRDRMCADAVRFATEIGYRNAGTVEFLLDPDGNYVFIEMNPRIQVEHTVTEEVTDVDLVQSQLRIAAGRDARRPRPLARTPSRCAAPRCSAGSPPRTPPTASAPTPARSRRTAPPAAPGVRLDGGTTYTGAEVSRALRLDAGQAHLPRPRPSTRRSSGPGGRSRSSGSAASPPTSRSCRPCSTTPTSPPATSPRRSSRPTRSCCSRAVSARPRHQAAHLPRRRDRQPAARRGAGRASTRSPSCPTLDLDVPAPDGTRQLLLERRARGVRPPAARAGPGRGHRHHVPRRPPVAARHPGPHPRPARGRRPRRPDDAASCGRSRRGAARRTTWRCASSPRTRGSGWPRCARRCRTSACRCCCAAATRSATRRTRPRSPTRSSRRRRRPASTCSGSSTRSTTSSRCGRRSRRCARPAPPSPRSRSATPATCPTPARQLYTLDYYLGLAERIVDAGAHVLAIKDMAGLLRAPAARTLVTALRERFDLPVHLHTHDTPGGQLGHPARRDRRRGRRRRRRVRVDGRHHLAAGALGAGRGDRPLRPRDRAVAGGGQRAGALLGGDPPGLRAVRVGPALADRPRLPPRDPRRPALQPAPAGDRARARREVRADRGHVRRRQRHPRQHRQGDAVVEGGRRPRPAPGRPSAPTRPSSPRTPAKFDIPDSVIGFLNGELGDPPGGWPEPFRTKALEGRTWKRAGRGAHRRAGATGCGSDRAATTLNELLFPGPTKEFRESRETYGDVSVLPTLDYLYGLRHGEEHEVRARRGQDAAPRARRRSASPTSAATAP